MVNQRLALGLFGGVLWLSLVAPPYVPRELNLDFAWMLSFAHYHHEGLQAGVDYVFTYGPLGFLASSVYDREILGLKLGWEFAFKLGIVLLALRHLSRLSGTAARVLYALALLLLLANQSYPDSGYLCAAFLLGIFLIEKASSPGWLALGLPVLCVLGLVKFTQLVFGAGVTSAVAVAALAARGPAHAAGVLVYAALAFAGLWLISDQELANLPVYLSRSAAMASGYDEAMALEGRSAEIALGVPLLLLNVGSLGGTLLARARSLERVLAVGLGAFALAVSWRHGFVRSGGFHFFAFAGLLPFLLAPPGPRSCVGARLCTGLFAVAVAIATAGLAVANGEERAPRQFLGAWAMQLARAADLLRDPSAWRASREQELEMLRAHYDLPRVRARVGRETIDVFHYEQGAVLLNGLRWQPRPVPSYATYTQDFLRLNAAFFESDAAPRFVLYRHQTLDDRAPLLDDATAIQVVLRRYAPVLTEGPYLLLERRTEPSAAGPAVVFEHVVRLGETVDLREWGSETLTLELEAHYTVRGRIRRAWLRAPPLFLEVEPRWGPRRRMRVVPSMASESFVVSPWLPSHDAFTNWRYGHVTPSIRSVRLVAPGQEFEPELRVIVRSDPRLAPDTTPDFAR